MGWLLATIGKSDKGNWELCKAAGLWGVSIQGENNYIPKAQKDDSLLFWVGGVGFVGYGKVTEDMRVPKSDSEIPWRGGLARYGFVVPFKITAELHPPLLLNFKSNLQLGTGIPLAYFRRGFQPITDAQANFVLEKS